MYIVQINFYTLSGDVTEFYFGLTVCDLKHVLYCTYKEEKYSTLEGQFLYSKKTKLLE